MPSTVLTNVHDNRYRFRLDRSERATAIIQLDPPGDPLIWPPMWAQWNRGQTTQARAAKLVARLTNEQPTSAWFRQTVLWLYS